MHKKILALCAALVALGALLVVPALASANPVLTENGVPVEPGKLVTGTGTGSSTFSAGGTTVKCNDYWITGKVHTNSTASGIRVTVEKATFRDKIEGVTKGCTASGTLTGEVHVTIPGITNEGGTQHWCLQALENADKGELIPRNCTEASGGSITFALQFTSAGITCRYARTATMTGDIITNVDTQSIKLTGEPEFSGAGEGNNFLCPASGKLIEMGFEIETDGPDFTALTISP